MTRASCGCGHTWTSLTAAHCSSCHKHFSTANNFDKHRRRGHCANPKRCGMVETDRGWSTPAPA